MEVQLVGSALYFVTRLAVVSALMAPYPLGHLTALWLESFLRTPSSSAGTAGSICGVFIGSDLQLQPCCLSQLLYLVLRTRCPCISTSLQLPRFCEQAKKLHQLHQWWWYERLTWYSQPSPVFSLVITLLPLLWLWGFLPPTSPSRGLACTFCTENLPYREVYLWLRSFFYLPWSNVDPADVRRLYAHVQWVSPFCKACATPGLSLWITASAPSKWFKAIWSTSICAVFDCSSHLCCTSIVPSSCSNAHPHTKYLPATTLCNPSTMLAFALKRSWLHCSDSWDFQHLWLPPLLLVCVGLHENAVTPLSHNHVLLVVSATEIVS